MNPLGIFLWDFMWSHYNDQLFVSLFCIFWYDCRSGILNFRFMFFMKWRNFCFLLFIKTRIAKYGKTSSCPSLLSLLSTELSASVCNILSPVLVVFRYVFFQPHANRVCFYNAWLVFCYFTQYVNTIILLCLHLICFNLSIPCGICPHILIFNY